MKKRLSDSLRKSVHLHISIQILRHSLSNVDYLRLLPVENSLGGFFKIYFYRLFVILAVALVTLVLVLLIIFLANPNKVPVFLSHPHSEISISESPQSLEQEIKMLREEHDSLAVQIAQLQAESTALEQPLLVRQVEIETRLERLQSQQRKMEISFQRILLIMGRIIFASVPIITFSLLVINMILYSREKVKLNLDFQEANGDRDHDA